MRCRFSPQFRTYINSVWLLINFRLFLSVRIPDHVCAHGGLYFIPDHERIVAFGFGKHLQSVGFLCVKHRLYALIVNEILNRLIVAFNAGSTKLIDSIDSWNEFAAAMNSGDYENWVDPDTGEINLVADISSGSDLVSVSELPSGAVFNGCGHSIKRANATEPLFVLVATGATVKNLTVGGTRVAPSAVEDRGTGNLAAFNRGTIENCVNETAVNITRWDKNLIIGGLLTDNAGILRDCRNTGDISVSMKISANRVVYGGAIAARAQRNLSGEKYSGTFINCENSGNILIKRSSTGIFSLTKFALGGICGMVDQGASDGVHARFEHCTNSGAVTYWQDGGHTNANYAYSVGGILGRSCVYNTSTDFYYSLGGSSTSSYDGYYVELVDCVNTGAIDASIYSATVAVTMSGARLVYVGGIAGCMQSKYDDWSLVSGCVSTGDIRVGSTARADCTGGLLGGAGQVSITGCKADVGIALSRNGLIPVTYMGLAGGAIGYVLRDVRMTDCDICLRYDSYGATILGAGFVGAVSKNTNIKTYAENPGAATLTLEGTNWFSGTIASEPVTALDLTCPSSQGVINGEITIK